MVKLSKGWVCMISEKMIRLTQNNSVIRAMFEEGTRLAALYGRENVYDFSLGNPNFPAPEAIKRAIIDVVAEEDHYIGNANTLRFHRPHCTGLPAEHNRVMLKTRDEAVSQGFQPCGICKP